MRYLVPIVLAIFVVGCKPSPTQKEKKPNIIIVFTDDQGYQDLGCYGSPNIKTPNIDQMASEGVRLTNFYVASSVCSASRAALLTGKLPHNNGVPGVFWPDQTGMDTAQVTIAEVLQKSGYRTACFGKWHLGDTKSNLPTGQGFDEYFGIPFSNDMYIGSKHEFDKKVLFNEGYTIEQAQADQNLVEENRKNKKKPWKLGLNHKVPLFENDKIVEYPAKQSTLTQRYFDKAIDFIKKSENNPFFVYITPAMPHIPLFASDQFKGKSERGLYGDVIEEIDFYMGRLLSHLKQNGLEENTLVIFTSDNGPWLEHKENGGSAAPLRGGKFSNYEGGVRVPGIFWWPGKFQSGTECHQIASTIDLLPTIAAYSGSDISGFTLDGQSIEEILHSDKTVTNTHLYSNGSNIWGIRVDEWKYMPHSGKKWATLEDAPELYNLKEDIGEQNNLIDSLPEKVEELKLEFEKHIK